MKFFPIKVIKLYDRPTLLMANVSNIISILFPCISKIMWKLPVKLNQRNTNRN